MEIVEVAVDMQAEKDGVENENNAVDETPGMEEQTGRYDMKDIISDIIEHVVQIAASPVNPLKVSKGFNPKSKIFECQKCHRVFAQYKSCLKHQKMCNGSVRPNPIVCPVCKHSFYDKQTLKRHIKRMHSSPPKTKAIFRCEECQTEFVMKHKLKEHNAIKHGLGQSSVKTLVKCPYSDCDFQHEKKRIVKAHVTNRHGNENHKQCTICVYKCLSDGGMRRHMKEVHIVSNNEEFGIKFVEVPVNTVDCPICDYKCLSDGGMKRHTREVHTVSTSEELEESLMNPEEVLVNAKKCPICDFECLSEDGIKRHMREVHPVSNIEEIERIGVDLEELPDCVDEVMENIDFILMNDEGFGLLLPESDVEIDIPFENM